MPALFDAHLHLQRFRDPDAVVAAMRRAGVTGCVVNGTCEDDWPAVARLAEDFPGFVRPAFGLHPWYAHHRSPAWQETLTALLDRFPEASIGECGLDGWVGEPSLEIQRAVFLPQLALARERELPVTIHALRAWEPLFEAFKTEPPPPQGFLLHSFGGSVELIRRLAPLGARFSFSGYFLQPRKAKVLAAYREVPPDRLLLETDAPDMAPPDEYLTIPSSEGNHPANLSAIAAGLAQSLGRPLEELAATTRANAERFFAPHRA